MSVQISEAQAKVMAMFFMEGLKLGQKLSYYKVDGKMVAENFPAVIEQINIVREAAGNSPIVVENMQRVLGLSAKTDRQIAIDEEEDKYSKACRIVAERHSSPTMWAIQAAADEVGVTAVGVADRLGVREDYLLDVKKRAEEQATAAASKPKYSPQEG